MWQGVYERLHSSSSDVKLIWFQYRCLKRILPTNRLLHNYGIASSDKCKSCPMYSETLAHKFWHCPTVRILWNEVEKVLNMQHQFSCHHVMLGVKLGSPDATCRANHLIYLTKWYIWMQRDQTERISYTKFKKFVRDYLQVEEYVSKISSQESAFRQKWGSVGDHFSE